MADTGLLDEDVGPGEKLHRWVERQNQRMVFDVAGEGGANNKFMQHLNPRHAGAVALAKPDEVERAQWCSSATFSSI